MHPQLHIDELTGPSAISTGRLPSAELVRALITEAYQRYRSDDEGMVADYIPALARVPPSLFGICVMGVNGAAAEIGDVDHAFSIGSFYK